MIFMKTILITGASSGIGKATALRFSKEGARLVLAARNTEALEALKAACEQGGTKALIYSLDVRDHAAVESMFADLAAKDIAIDALINNAGLALGMDDIKDGNPDDWDTMIDTNVKGLLYMTHEALRGMSARNSGHIVNIGSIAGTAAYAKGAVYCATKAAVRFISDALRQELVASDIRVTNVQPGMVETDFSKVRFKGDEGKASGVYKGIEALTPEDIAESICFAVLSPQNVQISEITVMPSHQAGPGVVHRKVS
jgi:3-hydroxy acid dehydrogenase / malonic semialdehyde reductase